jgi:hypothetical protein
MTTKTEQALMEKINQESTDIVVRANRLIVGNKAQLAECSFVLGGIKALLKEADKAFDPNIKRWHAGHTGAIADKRKITVPLLAAQTYGKKQARGYIDRMNRIAEEAAAKKLAKLQAEQDAKLKAEKEERDRRLAKLREELEALPDPDEPDIEEEIEKIEEEAAAPPPVIVVEARPAPKVKGISTQPQYSAKVVDFDRFARYCLDRGIDDFGNWLRFIEINQSELNAEARRQKKQFNMPGCELVTDTTVKSTG